ncbi:MAG TPA: serine--tRNA ligase [Acidimicrobiia bacterium]|nr:serine--tRNA ligase [Acidimicrobiia bacterium]
MIDLKRLRSDAEYRRGIERKRVREGLIDEVLAADEQHRAVVTEVEALRARQNAASKEIGKAAPDERAAKIEAAAKLKDELSAQEQKLQEVEARLRELALQIPNSADASVPDGGEDDGEEIKKVGEPAAAPVLDHAAFAEAIGFVDTARAAEASGSRFAYIMREAALLELALVNYALAAVVAHGFAPVITPTLVRERTMEEAGFFPTDRAQVYDVDGGELFLVGTSEVPLSALHRGETFTPDELPARYAGYSSCFRREAGTYGKDTRGIFRVHQFDKVEMFSWCAPDESSDELERILAIEEQIIGGLGLPYHVVNIAAGDLGPAAAKKYDIEAWLPSEGKYRELTSCSNYTDYSARRLGARVKGTDGSALVHTLNGTACAISRTLVFLFEHYQEADGGFTVPDALRPYVGFETVEPRK